MEIREVTDDEVAFYRENGWVQVRGLIDADTVSEMRRVGGELIDDSGAASTSEIWGVKPYLVRDGVEPHRSVALEPRMGRNAQRLMARERLTGFPVPVRLINDAVVCKAAKHEPTLPHEDFGGATIDRAASVAVWIALEDATPDMGTMRFLSGSYREGPFGHVTLTNILDQYPRLTAYYEWSPQMSYKAGDATFHHCCTIHEAPANTTDRGRWAHIMTYGSADALHRDNALDYKRFDDAVCPVIGSPEPAGAQH
ncbi:phytanoyl-CoA dioxygenase family protein [Streptomyces chartreusis]|uniref:phytanoyl-CoA dioxygenase family protein n=1 Tax=Streptomyces chartreusis TaxID=1969 RepID=UPI00362C22A8